MRKILFFILVLALCASVVLAQDAPPAGGPPPGGQPGDHQGGSRNQFQRGSGGYGSFMGASGPAMALMPPQAQSLDRLATQLSLTQDQRDKLTGILTKSDTSLTALRQKLSDANTALRNAVLDKTYDAAKVTAALTAAQKAESDLITAEMQTWSDVRNVLTPDQQAKIATAMSQRGGFGGGNRPGGNRPGGGYGNQPAGPPVPPPAPVEPPPPAPAT